MDFLNLLPEVRSANSSSRKSIQRYLQNLKSPSGLWFAKMDDSKPEPQFRVETDSLDINYVPWLTEEKKAKGLTYRELRRTNKDKVAELRKEMTEQLWALVNNPDGTKRKEKDTSFKGKTVALFNDDESKRFNESQEMDKFIKEVEETGLLIIDREGYDWSALKDIRCKDKDNKTATSIVQFGSILGSSIFVAVFYDCRFAHDDIFKDHITEAEHDELFGISGAHIPEKLVELLKESSIVKVQSSVYDDIVLLEKMLEIKIPLWCDLQNIYIMHQETKKPEEKGNKCGVSVIAKELGLPNAEQELRVDKFFKWKSPRNKKWSQWTTRQILYDLTDVLAPAIYLLECGVAHAEKEGMLTEKTNILVYIREELLYMLNEPSYGRVGKPKYWAWPHIRTEYGFGEESDEDEVFVDMDQHRDLPPWRPGVRLENYTLPGPRLCRNIRQLTTLLGSDRYIMWQRPEALPCHLCPPSVDRLATAKKIHEEFNPVKAPEHNVFKFPYSRQDKYATVKLLGEKREQRNTGKSGLGELARASGPKEFVRYLYSLPERKDLEGDPGPVVEEEVYEVEEPEDDDEPEITFEDFRPRHQIEKSVSEDAQVSQEDFVPRHVLESKRASVNVQVSHDDPQEGPSEDLREKLKRVRKQSQVSHEEKSVESDVDKHRKKARLINITNDRSPMFHGRCLICGELAHGDKGHLAAQCTAKVRCDYKLCATKAKHNLLVCETISSRCDACKARGHFKEAHLQYDPVSLASIFFAWNHLNAMTSLPVLAKGAEGEGRYPTDEEMRFGYFVLRGEMGICAKEIAY